MVDAAVEEEPAEDDTSDEKWGFHWFVLESWLPGYSIRELGRVLPGFVRSSKSKSPRCRKKGRRGWGSLGRLEDQAFLILSMSILFICSMACMERLAFSGSLLPRASIRAEGIICHESPYLSLSQPQRPGVPPAVSFSQRSSTSCCELQLTKREMASVDRK